MGKITILDIEKKKMEGETITALTSYDYPIARLVDKGGIDMILVGDSVGTVISGYPNTLPVTIDQMIYHAKAVTKAVERAFVVIDMPFGSFQVGLDDTVRNACRMIKETGAEAVKLEGGRNMKEKISALVRVDIPVMGHIGLTPQSIHRMGGHRVQGRDIAQRNALMRDAVAVQDAGAFAVVLEGIPADLAEEITKKLAIPTVGIGAGPHCDGQILVVHDLLGFDERFNPKFLRKYVDLSAIIQKAVADYAEDVREGKFPGPEQCYR